MKLINLPTYTAQVQAWGEGMDGGGEGWGGVGEVLEFAKRL